MIEENINMELAGYENTLVKEFRAMETLVNISRNERELILKGSPNSLIKNTEEKEAAIDRFSLLEENSRMFLQKIALKLQLQSERASIKEILPYLRKEDSERITRLLDGIHSLVSTARELNLGNQALVLTRMDWLMATQSFIASLMQPEKSYQMPLAVNGGRDTTISSMEYKV